MVCRLEDHVFEIDGVFGLEPPFPFVGDAFVDCHKSPEAVRVGGSRLGLKGRADLRGAQAIALGVLLEDAQRSGDFVRGDRLGAGRDTIGVEFWREAALDQGLSEPRQGSALGDLVRGGFEERGPFVGMEAALPGNAFEVAGFEVVRRIAAGVEREMLVIEVDVGIVEIRVVLPVRLVSGFVLVNALVLVGDLVVEQPVGDQALLLALDDLAVSRSESAAAIAVGV